MARVFGGREPGAVVVSGRWWRRLVRRWRALRDPAALDRQLDEELRAHLAFEEAEGLRAGLDTDEARRRALVAFGGLTRFREEAREARGVSCIE